MHGLTVALAITACTDYMKLLAPPQWLTTGQMLMSTVQNSIGRVVGCSFGGWFMQYGRFLGEEGGRGLYLLASCVIAGLLAVHLLLHLGLRCAGRSGLLVAPPAHRVDEESCEGTPRQ